ncbi:MAG: TolC family outer membrane protein [Steroidobacteraceae bacterium]
MKRGIFSSYLGGFATLVVASLPASSADLLSVYDQALINDPQIREAQANRMVGREARPAALASLLPQLSATAGRSRSWSNTNGTQELFPGDPSPLPFDSKSNNSGSTWSINLNQSVFSWERWVALRTADHQVAQSESDYLAALQSLAQRVAQQYFAVLNARDDLEAQEVARNAITRQMEQFEQRFEVGLIAITDVQEAKAERDNAAAQVISAKRRLASAEEQLRATIGEKPVALNELADNMPLASPNPASEEDWVRAAMEQNLTLISSRLAADIAREAVRSAFGGHLPTISLNAGRNFSDNSTRSSRLDQTTGEYLPNPSSPTQNNSKSLSLNFTLPLFSGGAVSSRERASEQRWIAAKERLEFTSRNTERQARDAYLGVNSEIARVQALKQALESSRTALAAQEAGYEVGTRTAVDVLNSRRGLILAETSYSAAKYSYLNNLIQLRLAAGDLDRATLEEINRWLTVAPATP